MAPRPLPGLRRRRRVLGARGHGADALPDRRGRGAGPRRAQKLAGDGGRAPARRRGARFVEPRLAHLLGLEERSPVRPAGSVRGLAALLRAPCRREPDRARVRGHAVGGHEPARLRRVPARVVARLPALRDHARAARAARAPPGLGRRPAQLHVALPGAALAGGDGGAARRTRPRPAGAAARADPRPRRGRPALRGRDRADAARPRAARPGRSRLPADGRDRDARGAGDAARADRRPPRRPPAGGAPAAPGRGRARQDLRRGALAALVRHRRGGARALALVARAQGGARRPVRPALARARPVRLPPGPRPPRRLRDALQARAQDRGTWPPPRYLEHVRRRGRGRRGARVALPRRLRGRTGRRRRAGDPSEGTRDARAGGRARRLAGAPEEGRRYFEQAAELTDDPLHRGRAARAGRPAGRPGEPSGRSARAAGTCARPLPGGGRCTGGRACERSPRRCRLRRRPLRRCERPLDASRRGARAGQADSGARCGAHSARPRARPLRPFRGGLEPLERALTLAERLQLPDVFVEALNSKGLILLNRGGSLKRASSSPPPSSGRTWTRPTETCFARKTTCGRPRDHGPVRRGVRRM